MTAVSQLAPTVGVAAACAVLGVPRASFYRQPVYGPAPARPTPPRALSQEERETVRAYSDEADSHSDLMAIIIPG